MVRRHPALTLAGAAVLLAGCAGSDPAALPTAADFERAQPAWSDPWLAPEAAAVPEAAWGSPDGYVSREAGTRTTAYATGTPEAVLLREVAAARAEGWVLTGATCGTDVAASLAKDDLRAVATAVAAGRGVEVEVTGFVPHHLDRSWPEPAPITRSCLRGGDVAALQLDDVGLGPPYDAADDPPAPDSTEWQRDRLSASEQALLDAVNADPWVAGLDLQLGADLAADDARRRAPVATTTVREPLTAVVDAMLATGSGWDLTWVSCGRGRDTEATARLVTDAGVAVARLTSDGRSTEVSVTTPVPETPSPDWVAATPPLPDASCAPRGDRVVVEGTPVALVTVSQPVG